MNNDSKTPTTRSATTIDAIFTLYLHNVQSKTYISYFSCHKQIISVMPVESENNNKIYLINFNLK